MDLHKLATVLQESGVVCNHCPPSDADDEVVEVYDPRWTDDYFHGILAISKEFDAVGWLVHEFMPDGSGVETLRHASTEDVVTMGKMMMARIT